MLVMLVNGACCRISVIAPATCGAAIDVPLNDANVPPGTDEVMFMPGASSERNGARFENGAIVLELLDVAPTEITSASHAGSLIASSRLSLPAAAMVGMRLLM